ncbi:MAG: hypothetical protein ACMXYC_03395 [Candidatus Woesearchaeota archaeon]
MAKVEGYFHPFEIPDDIPIVQCDRLTYPWQQDEQKYVLIRKQNKTIQLLFVEHDIAFLQLEGEQPYNLIKEIAKRNLVNLEHMGYLAVEIMRAKHAMDTNTEFVQR